jgi:hypothetical protein
MKAVPITQDMRVLAGFLGGVRALMNRGSGVKDAKVGPQDGLQADQDAILGELAFAKLHNCWPDLSLAPRSGSADAVVKGKRIDIKTTRRPDGRLLSTIKTNPDVDVYVLAILHDDKVIFPGWAYADELHSDARKTNLGHGLTYAMNQAELRSW